MAKQLNTNILDIVGSPTVTYDGIASFTKNNGFTIKSSAYTDSLVIILKLYYQTFTETDGANTIMRESKTGSNTAIYLDTFNQYKVVWYNAEYGKVSDSDLEIYKFRPDTYCFLRITYTNSSIMGEILKDNITVTTTLEEALANSNWINLSWSKTVSNYFTDRLFQIGASDVFGWGGTIDLSNSSINGQKMFIEQAYSGTHIQLRHDTAANWTSVNPILLEGEVGIETDTGKSKFGDGSTSWNNLPYNAGSIASTALNSKADTDLSNLSATGKTVIDGQWVNVFQEAIGGTAQTINTNSSKDIEFSSLPAKNCEVMFSINQSTSYDLAISSYLLSSTTNRALKQGCITVIMPVSSNKKITVRNLGSGTASINFVRMCGYRVLGTNTNS